MKYEPLWEQFEAVSPEGARFAVRFLRAGFLTLGDHPELFFFRVTRLDLPSENLIEEVAVGISGDALKRFEKARRSLSREEKMDLAGLLLKKAIETAKKLDSNNLLIRDSGLAALAGELRIPG